MFHLNKLAEQEILGTNQCPIMILPGWALNAPGFVAKILFGK